MSTVRCDGCGYHCECPSIKQKSALPPVRSEPLLADQLTAAMGLRSALEFALRHIDCHAALMKARKALDVAENSGINSTANAMLSVPGERKETNAKH